MPNKPRQYPTQIMNSFLFSPTEENSSEIWRRYMRISHHCSLQTTQYDQTEWKAKKEKGKQKEKKNTYKWIQFYYDNFRLEYEKICKQNE